MPVGEPGQQDTRLLQSYSWFRQPWSFVYPCRWYSCAPRDRIEWVTEAGGLRRLGDAMRLSCLAVHPRIRRSRAADVLLLRVAAGWRQVAGRPSFRGDSLDNTQPDSNPCIRDLSSAVRRSLRRPPRSPEPTRSGT